MDQGPSLSASFLTELDLSDGASLLRPAGRVTPKDLILGAGGSTLAHMLVAVALLLMPTIQPQPMSHGSFVTVNLVERGGSIGGSSDAGSVEGAEGAPQIEASRPSPEKPREKAPLPDPPKTVKRVERVSSSAGKAVKKAPASPQSEPLESASASAIPSDGSPSAAAPSDRDASPQIAGTSGEEGQGAKGSGDGRGFSSADGSSAGSGADAGEFNADAVDQIPQALQKVEPMYPPRARMQGVCGKVVLRFLVEPDGHVSRPSILAANPEGYFEQSALEAIRRWRFKPGIYRGKAVATWMVLPVQFKLTS